MTRHKRTIEQKFKAIVAMIVAMGLVSGFTLQDGTISPAHSAFNPSVLKCGKEEHFHDGTCCNVLHDHDSASENCVCSLGKEAHQHDSSCYCVSHTPDTPIDNGDGTHTIKCSTCGDSYTEDCENDYSVKNNGDGTHKITCNVCGYNSTNSHTYTHHIIVSKHNGTHSERCDVCSAEQNNTPCSYSARYVKAASGKYIRYCDACYEPDEISADAGSVVQAYYDFIDTAIGLGYDWSQVSDIYEDDFVTLVPYVQSWIDGLSYPNHSDLVDKGFTNFIEKLAALGVTSPADYADVSAYMSTQPEFMLAYDLVEALYNELPKKPNPLLPPLGSPLAGGAPLTFEIQDKVTPTPNKITDANVEYKVECDELTNGVWKQGYGIEIVDSSTPSSQDPTSHLISLKDGETVKLTEITGPSGYIKKGAIPITFVVHETGTLVTSPSSADMTFDAVASKLVLAYDKIETKEVYFKFIDDANKTTAATASVLADGKVKLAVGSDEVTLTNAGSVIKAYITNDPNVTKAIDDATGKIIIKDGVTVKITNVTAPYGFNDLDVTADREFDTSYSAGTVAVKVASKSVIDNYITSIADDSVYISFVKLPTQVIDIDFDGSGATSSTRAAVYDKATGKKMPVTSGNKVTVYAGREYEVSAENLAKGYVTTKGSFKYDDGASTVVITSGTKLAKKNATAVTLTLDEKFDSDDEIDFTLYAKDDDDDAPNTSKKLKGWKYNLYYLKDGVDYEDADDDDWKELMTLTASESESTVSVKLSKLYAGRYYKLVEKTAPSGYEKDSKPAYIYIDGDGNPHAIKGNVDDDDDEVQLYNAPVDEDSDDVIAIHKQTSTGTELAGAKLQIYLYTADNTLAYGSSSSTTSSSSNSTTSSSSSSSNSSSSNSSNSSSSSTSTRAKITPSKPTVATSDILFDWTSGDKAYTIDIDKLEKGKNYTLREVSAPSGYETPAYDFVFKYNTDGTLTVVRNYANLLSVSGNKLILKNQTPTEAAATRPKTGDHSKLALWLDICIVMLGGLYLSGYSIVEAFTEKKKVKVVAKKKANNRRRR